MFNLSSANKVLIMLSANGWVEKGISVGEWEKWQDLFQPLFPELLL